METLFQDLRYGSRALLKTPVLVASVTITLALGIGLNATAFSVIHAILINPLRFKDPSLLVMIWKSNPAFGLKHGEASLPEYLDWKQLDSTFDDIAAFREEDLNVSGGRSPERIACAVVTASFFSVLNITPLAGRSFSAEDNEPGRNSVVLLSHGLSVRGFGDDLSAIGKIIAIDEKPYTVVGVMPASFKLRGRATDAWIPVAFDHASMNRRLESFKVIARLGPRVSLGQAQSDMTLTARHLAENNQTSRDLAVTVVPLHEEIVGRIKSPLLILFWSAGLVLLIACANVVNLLLSRTSVREKEMSIRAALGASRLRITRQFVTEGVLLALYGGGLGLLLSFWTLGSLTALNPEKIPRLEEVGVGGWTIAFTLAVSVLIGVVCGLLSAKQVSKPEMNDLLKAEGRTATSGRGGRVRALLLISEVALSLMLLISAGLLVKSFERLWNTKSGFNPENVLTMEISLSSGSYADASQQTSFFRQALDRIVRVPGVQSSAVASSLPIMGVEAYSFDVGGQEALPGTKKPTASRQAVSPDYFGAMGIPLLAGRVFSEKDIAGEPGVAIINRAMARLYWGDENPIGKRIKTASIDAKAPGLLIVGVVGDVRESGLDSPPEAEFYVPYFQDPTAEGVLVVRGNSNVLSLASGIHEAISAVDKNQPIANVRTMENILAESVDQQRFIMSLLGIFAALAFILSTVGVYGVISYSLSQRTREIGIRIALGAQPRHVLKLAMGQSMTYVILGTVLGLIGALASGHLISALLYEVSPTDLPTFFFASALIVGVSLTASYIPARRATKLPPVVALRHE